MISKVRKANQLSAEDIAGVLNQESPCPFGFTLDVRHSRDLREDEKIQIFDLFACNMRQVYERSSFGWDPSSKRQELFDSLSRFVLVRRVNGDPSAGAPSADGKPIVAYTMFRFDREDKKNVVYCYELQVSSSARKLRLGQHLMSYLQSVAYATGMSKVMLTVQKVNTAALEFYEHIGFKTDPTSPDYDSDQEDDGKWVDENGEEDDGTECDYGILSKVVASSTSS